MKSLAWGVGLVAASAGTLLAVIGSAGRAPLDYNGSHMTARDQENLLAYSVPVQSAAALNAKTPPAHSLEALEVWLSHYRGGRLVSVPPTYLDDMGDRGVRGEILRGRKRVSSRIYILASQAESRNPVEAARLYRDLVTLNDVFKFSSPESMSDSAFYQHSALKALARLAPSLSQSDRDLTRKMAIQMERPSQPLGPFALRINAAYQRSIDGGPMGGMVISNALKDMSSTTPEIVEAKSSTFSTVGNQEEMLRLISSAMFMALRAEQRVREDAAQLLAELDRQQQL